MRNRITVAAIATTAALGAACAFTVPAASASPAVKTHTVTFISVQESTVHFSKTVLSQQDKDVNKAGKTIGYDLLYIVFNPKTETARFNLTAAISGGFVYGAVANSGSGPVTRGTVTGGTGIFQGAKGTLQAKSLNKAGTRTQVTITYHT